MGLSASQGRMLLLTARKNDLEFQAQQISQRRLILAQQLEEISTAYQDATSNRQMKITLYKNGNDQDGTKETVNLDYASLVSGVYASGDTYDTGLQPSDRIRLSGKNSSSNVAYRLVSADGKAIIISDKSEIPGSITKTETVTPKTSVNGEATDLSAFLKNDDDTEPRQELSFAYGNDGIIQVTYKTPKMTTGEDGKATQDKNPDGTLAFDTKRKYFNASTGSAINNFKDDDFIQDEKAQPNSITVGALKTVQFSVEKVHNLNDDNIQEGDDGKIRLLDNNGVVLFTYIVDEALKYRSTDKNGSTGDGPNYLQDCIRNGKYLIQKGGQDPDDNNKYKWRDLSWDATANITDSYYTDDDEAAKAKYDRLQTQIQNQDKKLELELDNIETQRSAVTTEIDSVQKVIDDNVEDSFKIFNA